jgi:hypothetical protein
MKKKIQDALELAYKDKLGLADKKVYARVAALGETYVAKDEDIPAFVEKAEDLLKGFQATADQGRTLETANAKIAELEDKLKKFEGKEEPAKEKEEKPDFAKAVADAVAAAIAPLTEKITALETVNSAKEALAGARSKFFDGDYAKKYKDEADDAWDRAVEVNELTGNKMTADQLAEKATGYFNKAVSKKGVDTTKPFVADPQENDQDGTTDWSAEKKRLQEAGRLPKDQ